MIPFDKLDDERPVLIAGPTASGKSSLAMEVVKRSGGVIINADALQVFANWRVLTARPTLQDETCASHRLYGHVGRFAPYSVGHWLREITPILKGSERPVIVGGTGLYFSALTEGLVEVPEIPAEVRTLGDEHATEVMLADLDARTIARIDTHNRARVQRAWEVLRSTGRSIADWQDDTPPPLLPLTVLQPFVIDAPREFLTPRIERRFDTMLEQGALDEVRDNLFEWDPSRPSSKAIGAPELIAHLRGEMSLEEAREAATIATRQYAKRQRTWFRARMKTWNWIAADGDISQT